jgi:hypothetical protein
MRRHGVLLVMLSSLPAACGGPDLDTRTFQVQYLPTYQVDNLIAPYVFSDREGSPGMMSTTEGAVTVRETEDNLDKIARVLEQYDQPRPTVMLHFQIIEADGVTGSDPAIADVEEELRRLFRFEGYGLLAETKVGGIAGTRLHQTVRAGEGGAEFGIAGGVSEVRTGASGATVTLDVELVGRGGRALATTVTIPTDHTVVLGTAQAAGVEGALILTVRAEVVESGTAPAGGGDAGEG